MICPAFLIDGMLFVVIIVITDRKVKTMNILLVDKENSIQKLLGEIASKWRCNIIAVTTIPDAIKAIHDGVCDLIIADHDILDTNEKETGEKIEDMVAGTPIIVVRSKGAVKIALEYINFGPDDYSVSSFSTDKIKLSLEDMLRTEKILEINKRFRE